jgi:hypothetical protein
MAFGGIGGLAGGVLVQATSIHPAGQYVSVSQNGRPSTTAADNVFWRKNGPGETVPGIENLNNAALQEIIIASIAVQGEDNFLDGCDTDDSDDTGFLVTAIPGVGEHGLPVNFGRGRNKWRPGDEDYINVWFRLPGACQAVTGTFSIAAPDVEGVEFVQFGTSADAQSALGNIKIIISNRGTGAIAAGTGFPDPPQMIVQFLHTIQR